MASKKKVALISACSAAVVIAGGLGAIYKTVATPERVVEVSMLNTYNEAKKSFNLSGDKEWDIIKSLPDGGKTDIDFTIKDIPLLGDTNIGITSNSDGNCSVSDISLGSFGDIKTYKDDEEILINTSLFNGGFKIPIKNFAEEWNNSALKDLIKLPESDSPLGLIAGAANHKESIKAFVKDNISEIKGIAEESLNNIKLDGTANVMVGTKAKKAKVYRTTLTKDQMQKLTDLVENYIKNDSELSSSMSSFADLALNAAVNSYDIAFKVDAMKVRELEITPATVSGSEGDTDTDTKSADNSSDKTGGDTYTVAFYGEDNPMDMVAMYVNGDTQNAIRRIHTEKSGTVTETITANGSEAVLTDSKDSTTITVNGADSKFELNGYGKSVSNDTLSYSDAELTAGSFSTSGTISVSKLYDKDFSFDKSGEYIDILNINPDELSTIFSAFFGGIDLFGSGSGSDTGTGTDGAAADTNNAGDATL